MTLKQDSGEELAHFSLNDTSQQAGDTCTRLWSTLLGLVLTRQNNGHFQISLSAFPDPFYDSFLGLPNCLGILHRDDSSGGSQCPKPSVQLFNSNLHLLRLLGRPCSIDACGVLRWEAEQEEGPQEVDAGIDELFAMEMVEGKK